MHTKPTIGRRGRKPRVDLLAPPPAPEMVLRVQLALSGVLAQRVKELMERYGLEQGTVVRMLMVDGLEARERRNAQGLT